MKLTGERVVTGQGAHNPTWQRHVAAYRLVAPMLRGERLLDLGCGIGHSYRLLGRPSIGLDRDRESVAGQVRPVVRADMRHIPLGRETVSSVVSVQSIEHVPDPERVLAEVARVVRTDGVAVFVTPNRLTFGSPDEIIDPFHYVEFDANELKALCSPAFESVEVVGLVGSDRYLSLWADEMASLKRMLGFDPLKLRRRVPRKARQSLYGFLYRRARGGDNPLALSITNADFDLRNDDVDDCLDLVAVCHRPIVGRRN